MSPPKKHYSCAFHSCGFCDLVLLFPHSTACRFATLETANDKHECLPQETKFELRAYTTILMRLQPTRLTSSIHTALWASRAVAKLPYALSTIIFHHPQNAHLRRRGPCCYYYQFINCASESDLPVGRGLESCTVDVQMSKPFYLDQRMVTLIDTPGFDDTNRKERDILTHISAYLANT